MSIFRPRGIFTALGTACLISLALAGSASALTFAPATFVPQANKPYSVITEDFNRDGYADLASANRDSNTVSVQLGNGTGGFTLAGNFATGSRPFAVTSADFDGDGFLDLATANFSSNDVTVMSGNGFGTFGPPVSFPLFSGAGAYSIVSADFDRDGNLDLATANQANDTVSVLLGNGAGSFALASTVAVGDNPHRVVTADFNLDGYQDLVTSNADAASLSVLLGDGYGGFAPASTLPLGAGVTPISVITADFNGDGFPDLATANVATHVSVLLGDGNGGFGAPVRYTAFAGPYVTEVTSGDFDGDGHVDLAAVNIAAYRLSVLLGDGSGAFGPPLLFPVSGEPESLASADFNEDGLLDFATASVGVEFPSGYSILLNSSPPPPRADVTVEKTAPQANYRPGDEFEYEIKASNSGTATAHDVVVTDSLPAGLTFLAYQSPDAPCAENLGTLTCDVGDLSPGQQIGIRLKVRVDQVATGLNPDAGHQLDVQRVEAQIDLDAGQTRSVSVNCPSGYFASDGSVRIDHVDQGTGDWTAPEVLESRAGSLGTWRGTVRNTASGRAQAKIFAVCIRQTSVDGTHTHHLEVSAPVTAAGSLPAGASEQILECGPGQVAIQPGFESSQPTDLVYSQPEGNGWKFVVENHVPSAVSFSIRCLTRNLSTEGGHTHDLGLERIWHEFSVESGKVNEAQLTCADGSKGILAGWDLDHGLLSLGNDPRPVTQAYRIYNPTDHSLRARLSLLCLGTTTGGERLGPTDIVNTAYISTSSNETETGNNQSSATISVEDTDIFTPVPDPPTVKPTPNSPIAKTIVGKGVSYSASGVTFTLKCSGSCGGFAKLTTLKRVKVKGKGYRRGTVLAKKQYFIGKAGSKRIKLKLTRAGKGILKSGKVKRASLRINGGTSKVVKVGRR